MLNVPVFGRLQGGPANHPHPSRLRKPFNAGLYRSAGHSGHVFSCKLAATEALPEVHNQHRRARLTELSTLEPFVSRYTSPPIDDLHGGHHTR